MNPEFALTTFPTGCYTRWAMVIFSKRTNWAKKPNPLAQKLQELRTTGAEFIDLTQSNPTQCQFGYLNKKLLAPFSNTENLTYDPHPRGLEEARTAICEYYRKRNVQLSPDQIVLTSGTSEAYGFLFRLLTNPGDALLTPIPSYPLLDYLGDLNDITFDHYSLNYKQGWRMDMEKLKSSVHAKTKALLLIHPNNPTGHFILDEERDELIQISRRHSLPLISDEVFLDFAFSSPSETRSFAETKDVLSFTLSGISKVLGLPQMKLSWIVVNGPEDAKQEALSRLEIIADTHLSVATPVQRTLPEWFKVQAPIQEEIRSRVNQNLGRLRDCVKEEEAPRPSRCRLG